MNKTLIGVGLLLASLTVSAQNVDTLRVNRLDEVQIISNRATKRTPLAFSNLDKKAIERMNFGQDIPFLLSTLPSVVTTSDAGNGIGYTAIRVRGSVGERINVTNNGIPLNDPEAHTFYWVDTPDLASSLQDIQLQRGVGTSTNGAAAFGASINMITDHVAAQPFTTIQSSMGSFATTKNTVKVGTGLIDQHWAFDTRLSYLASDGYRDRASSRLGSYFLQGAYLNNGTTLKIILFGGKERTYHAWDGISRKQLETARTYNPNGAIGKTGRFYDNQVDIFFQQHAQALLTQCLTDHLHLTAALHYTYGQGYYEEYKNDRKLKKFGLKPFLLDGKLQEKSDLVRRKQLEGNFGGVMASLNYRREQIEITGGGGFNYFHNDHYGNVIWVKNYAGDWAPNHKYYDNTGKKSDGNAYIRVNYALLPSFNLFGDLQYRHIGYKIAGTSDKKAVHDTDVTFDFFNPKGGVTWFISPHNRIYASISVAHREPTRNNYEESFSNHAPRAERLIDYEIGYHYTGTKFDISAGAYWMQYKDQFVLNGQINEIGEAISENVADSYRAGIELSSAWRPTSWFQWDANATFSRNRIRNYAAWLPDANWEKSLQLDVRKSATISFSPSVILNSRMALEVKKCTVALIGQYVSRQYLDNLSIKDNSLDPYFVAHLSAAYAFQLKNTKEISVGATIYNLFNARYETNGYSQSYMDVKGTIHNDPRFYPMAGCNFLINVGVKF